MPSNTLMRSRSLDICVLSAEGCDRNFSISNAGVFDLSSSMSLSASCLWSAIFSVFPSFVGFDRLSFAISSWLSPFAVAPNWLSAANHDSFLYLLSVRILAISEAVDCFYSGVPFSLFLPASVSLLSGEGCSAVLSSV